MRISRSRFTAMIVLVVAVVGASPLLPVFPTAVANAAISCRTVTLPIRFDAEMIGGSYSYHQKYEFKVGVVSQNNQDYFVCTAPKLTQWNVNTGYVDYFIAGVTFTQTHRASDGALILTMKGHGSILYGNIYVVSSMTFHNFGANLYHYMYLYPNNAPNDCQWRFTNQTNMHACGTSSTSYFSLPA